MSATPLLFDDDPPRFNPRRPPRRRDRAHAATPGTGPVGETCGSCAHYRSLWRNTKRFRKCAKMQATWTHGPGTDIRARDAACARWEPQP